MNLAEILSPEYNQIVWVDGTHKRYRRFDIADSHLLNILNAVYRGVGWREWRTVEKINVLYDEAEKRSLKPRYKRHTLINRMEEENKGYEY